MVLKAATQEWYAVYTKPRWEKKVNALLEEKGVITYCPLNKVRKKWSDRYKIIQEPLFKSYVFVNVSENQMASVRMMDGVVNFVYWNGKPATIRDEEINLVRKFLNEYEFVAAEAVHFSPNQRVQIMSGVWMNETATVTRCDKNKVQLVLDSLGFKLTAQLSQNEIRPV